MKRLVMISINGIIECKTSIFKLEKPLAECKVGMIATGGVYKTGQVAFHYKDDTSYRAIPSDTKASNLRATHFAYDLSGAREDINVVFPLKALELSTKRA